MPKDPPEKLERPSSSTSGMHLLVYAFLLHNNYGKTAEAFSRGSKLVPLGILSPQTSPRYLTKLTTSEDEDMANGTNSSDNKQQSEYQAQQQLSGPAGMVRPLEGIQSGKTYPDLASGNSEQDTMEIEHSSSGWGSSIIEQHLEHLQIRQSTYQSIVAGEVDAAIDLLSTYFPSVIIPPPGIIGTLPPMPCRKLLATTMLRFRLDTQHFIELIRRGLTMQALEFAKSDLHQYPRMLHSWIEHTARSAEKGSGNDSDNGYLDTHFTGNGDSRTQRAIAPSTLHPLCKPGMPLPSPLHKDGLWDHDSTDSESDWEPASLDELRSALEGAQVHMADAAALMAYESPEKSPVRFLLTEKYRKQLAEDVNTATLLSTGFPPEPAIATLVRQLTASQECLRGYHQDQKTRNLEPELEPWTLGKFLALNGVTTINNNSLGTRRNPNSSPVNMMETE